MVYQCDDSGLEKAFNYRLGCVREPGIEGLHEQLLANQRSFMSSNVELNNFVEDFSRYVEVWLSRYDDLDLELIKYAQQPHPKRKLRLRALKAILNNGDLWHVTFNRKVSGKMKKAEIAKYGKASRMINDLTCEGSLLCGFVADQIKQALAEYSKDHWFQFVKSPNLDVLAEVFRRLIDPVGQLYFPFFSDDSCVSIRCADGVYYSNVDISSCDGSHTEAVFDLLRKSTKSDSRLFRYVDGAIAQCSMELRIRSGATGQSVGLTPDIPTLYSGSTLTTLINNFANIAIACAIRTSINVDTRMCDCEAIILNAAKTAGYLVTVVDCPTYHKLQFLKHSPCIADCGTLVPVLNLGVVLRSSGSCWGDLPNYREHGKMTLEDRIYLYNTSQVQCYSNCPTYGFLAALRAEYHAPYKIARPSREGTWLMDHIAGDYSKYMVSSQEIALRYDVSSCSIDELNFTIGCHMMSNTAASRAILKLDYGFF